MRRYKNIGVYGIKHTRQWFCCSHSALCVLCSLFHLIYTAIHQQTQPLWFTEILKKAKRETKKSKKKKQQKPYVQNVCVFAYVCLYICLPAYVLFHLVAMASHLFLAAHWTGTFSIVKLIHFLDFSKKPKVLNENCQFMPWRQYFDVCPNKINTNLLRN